MAMTTETGRGDMKLEAYFDESGIGSNDEQFALVGVVAYAHHWRQFEPLWRTALQRHGAPYLHMREFAHRRGAFKGWSEDQRQALMSDCLKSLCWFVFFTIGATMNIVEAGWRDPEGKPSAAYPWLRCYSEVLRGVQFVRQMTDSNHQIRCVYSRQDEFASHLRAIHEQSRGIEEYLGALGPLEFGDMRDEPALQVADLVAYELRHHYHLQKKRPGAPYRFPYQVIMRWQMHFTGWRTLMMKNLPGWYLEAERTGKLKEKMDAIHDDPAAHVKEVRDLHPYPVDLRRIQLLEVERLMRQRGENTWFRPLGPVLGPGGGEMWVLEKDRPPLPGGPQKWKAKHNDPDRS
jgi:hypothetical protein